MLQRIVLIFLLIFYLLSCSKNKKLEYEALNEIDPYQIYQEGYIAFEKGDYFYANKKFSEAELAFETVEFAAKSAIMSSYALYGINFYDAALENLERYLKKYPADKNVMYAHYLSAIIHYEQISDEKKDLQPLLKATEKIKYFLKNYPDSDYAIDLRFKKDLIQNQRAAKELYVAKYYISIQKWIPAINRLKFIIKEYSETVFIEEALHRLVEVYYRVGLLEEAKAVAAILGYNYNSSEWYKQTYKILNKSYKLPKKTIIKKNDGLIKRTIKKILN